MRLWQSLRISWQRSSTISKATKNADYQVVANFLEKYPDQEQYIAKKALSFCDDALWYAFLLVIGLFAAKSPRAISILEKLLEYDLSDWMISYFEPEHRRILISYLEETHSDALLIRLLENIGGGIEHHIIEPSCYFKWLEKYIDENKPVKKEIKDQLVKYLEASAFETKSLTLDQFDQICQVGVLFWNQSKVEEAIEIFSLLTMTRPQLMTKDMLTQIAEHLPNLIPERNAGFVLPENLNPTRFNEIQKELERRIPPIPLSIIRSANLLYKFPSASWMTSLKKSWITIDDLIRCPSQIDKQEYFLSAELILAANALARALGICAARDPDYTDLQIHDSLLKQLNSDLEKLVKTRNKLVSQLNELINKYKMMTPNARQDSIIEENIIEKRDQISELDEQIESINARIKDRLSPGVLLLNTLNDGQAYHSEVRQGAAWGLSQLQQFGALTEDSRHKINHAIFVAVYESHDAETENLKKSINTLLPEDKEIREQVFNAVWDYIEAPNLNQLEVTLKDLLQDHDDLRNDIIKISEVLSSNRHELSHEFRERLVHFLPAFNLLENEQELHNALTWMSDLGIEKSIPSSKNLRWIIQLLHQLIPGAFDFLCHYPLRLMTMDQHKKILGQYSRHKCDISLWTRYTPPVWRRGAQLDEVGQVLRRFLVLDDRSKPNDMGIYYRLFEHPVLALPVIYHEYLHYGGPSGNPNQGIENETEVLLREIIFARSLISQLSPENDDDIPHFEQELIGAIESAELEGLGWQLNYDFETQEVFESIGDEIEATYGKQLSKPEAQEEIERLIAMRNRNIQLANNTDEQKLNWNPDIEWPDLGDTATSEMTVLYQQIVEQYLLYNHRIDYRRCQAILNDPICQKFIKDWEIYKERSQALVEFRITWPVQALYELKNVIPYIVNRFKLRLAEENNPNVNPSLESLLFNLFLSKM